MEQSKYIIVYIRLCPDLDYSTFYKTVVFQTVPPLRDLILQIAFDSILRVGVTVCLSGPTKTSSVQPYLRGTDWCRKSTTPWIYQGELRLCGHTGILNSYQKDEAPKLIRNQIKEMVQYPPLFRPCGKVDTYHTDGNGHPLTCHLISSMFLRIDR